MKFAVALIVSLVIGGVLLYLAAVDLPLDDVVAYIKGADRSRLLWSLLGYSVLFSIVHLVRMWRWAYLLKSVGTFTTGQVLRAAAIGFAAIIVLPLRLGELVRPYVLARETGTSMSAALGTAVVERVMDGLFITLLLFITLGTYSGTQDPGFALAAGWVALFVFASALGVSLMALWKRQWTLGVLERIGNTISAKLTAKVLGLLEGFLDGIESLKALGSLGSFLALTAVYWGLNGLSIAFLGWFGFGLELGAWEGMTVLAVLVVGLMIPTGPGMAGNYEFFALQGLGLFVPAAEVVVAGAAFVASMHVVQFLIQALPGLILLWAGGGGFLALMRESSAELEQGHKAVQTDEQ